MIKSTPGTSAEAPQAGGLEQASGKRGASSRLAALGKHGQGQPDQAARFRAMLGEPPKDKRGQGTLAEHDQAQKLAGLAWGALMRVQVVAPGRGDAQEAAVAARGRAQRADQQATRAADARQTLTLGSALARRDEARGDGAARAERARLGSALGAEPGADANQERRAAQEALHGRGALGMAGRQELPSGQDLTASLHALGRQLQTHQASPHEPAHEAALRVFEGGGELVVELGAGEQAQRVKLSVVEQRVELSWEGAARDQLLRLRQELEAAGFEVTFAQSADAAGQDAQQRQHQAAREALAMRLRARGAAGQEAPHEPSEGAADHEARAGAGRRSGLGLKINKTI